MKTKHVNLLPIFKWIIIISVILFIAAALNSCAWMRHMGTAGRGPKYTRVQCPTYPQHHHWVRTDRGRGLSPDTCPAYRNGRQSRKKKGFGPIY